MDQAEIPVKGRGLNINATPKSRNKPGNKGSKPGQKATVLVTQEIYRSLQTDLV